MPWIIITSNCITKQAKLMLKLMHFPKSHSIGKWIGTQSKSLMANAITKSNILVEAYVGSTLSVNNPPSSTNNYKMTSQDWIGVQAKDPVISELVQL